MSLRQRFSRRDLRSRLARRSLRSRLSWSASTLVAFWVLVLAIGGNLLLQAGLAGQANSVLEARAEAVSSTVRVATDRTITVRRVDEDWALDIGTWVIAGNGEIVKKPEGSSVDLDLMALYLSTQGDAVRDMAGADPVRLFALPVRRDGIQVATVVTSTSLAPYGRLERLALWGSIAIAVLVLLIVHLVLRVNVRRALRPMQQMSEQAGRWSADDVDRRFGTEERPAELADLAATLDGVLDRLGAVLRYEQRLTAELSHELRTPVARMRAELDLTRSETHDPAVVEGLASMDAAIRDLQEIIETLLREGRSGRRTAPGRCRPAEVVTSLVSHAAVPVSTLDGHPGTAEPVVVSDVDDDLVVGVDGAVLQRLLAPVVDNARRYARETIEVSSERRDGDVVLVVDDDGPGVSPDDVDLVFDPGWRADPEDGHPGGGLGLALARRLATACGGSVRAVARTDGGRFEVTLPAG